MFLSKLSRPVPLFNTPSSTMAEGLPAGLGGKARPGRCGCSRRGHSFGGGSRGQGLPEVFITQDPRLPSTSHGCTSR